MLDVVTIAFFGALAVAGAVLDAHDRDWIDSYSTTLSSGVLGLVALTSLAFTPFTEQYARDFVPEHLWGSPKFKAANRQLTAMWGAVFAAMVPLHIIAGSIDTQRSNLIFNWVLPGLLVMWALKRSTADTPAPAPAVHA
jgi:hypothetical protein